MRLATWILPVCCGIHDLCSQGTCRLFSPPRRRPFFSFSFSFFSFICSCFPSSSFLPPAECGPPFPFLCLFYENPNLFGAGVPEKVFLSFNPFVGFPFFRFQTFPLFSRCDLTLRPDNFPRKPLSLSFSFFLTP